jgi:5-methylcytosine-specific restriction endonuclease McrA
MTLIAKGKVEVLKYGERVINGALKIPAVMRLIKLIRTIYKTRVPFSKKNVMIRDGFKCVYCGSENVKFTIDHVLAKARGGISSFENCVTACKPCNHKKGHRLCREVKMFPKTKLIAPTISEFLRMRMVTLGIDDIIKEIWANG